MVSAAFKYICTVLYIPQPAAMTFAFSSEFILLLRGELMHLKIKNARVNIIIFSSFKVKNRFIVYIKLLYFLNCFLNFFVPIQFFYISVGIEL